MISEFIPPEAIGVNEAGAQVEVVATLRVTRRVIGRRSNECGCLAHSFAVTARLWSVNRDFKIPRLL